MYISKKKTYKILACAMSAIFFGSFSGVASAEDENSDSEPDYSSNVVTTINETNYSSGDIYGKYSNSDASHQTLNVSNIKTNAGRIDAGVSEDGNANCNILNIRNVTATALSNFFHGGWAGWDTNGNGSAEWNIINFYSGNAYEIHGAHTYSGDAKNNTVNFFDGKVTHEIGGGYSVNGNVNKNTLNISGGTIYATVFGGRASYSVGTSGDAIGNYMNISGGKFGDEENEVKIYGGWAPNGSATGNEINIYGNPDLANAILLAGKGISDDAVSDNTLKIHTKKLTVKDIGGFENLNFYLPADTAEGDTILTVTNPTNKISNKIYVFKDEGFNLNDEEITLITTGDDTKGLDLGEIQPTDENDSDYTKISKVYSTKEGYTDLITGLTINAKDITEPTPEGEYEAKKMQMPTNNGAINESMIFNEPMADSVSLLDSGTDRILEWPPPEGVDYMNSAPTAGFDPFIGIGGSSLKIDTGNGTELKTKSGGINFGMTRYLKNRHGMFIVAPVIDYGQDSYESTLPDDNKTKGSGNSKYFTAGFIARQVNVNGMYYEASVRGGKIRTDFTSNNFLVNGEQTTASYEASTPCYSAHFRVGWRDHISPQNILDVYGMYSLNRVNGFTTKVSTGQDYSFHTVNSGRMRIGARFTRELKERENVYTNLAYIHEFSCETFGEYNGMSIPRAGLKGSAGLIELGWQVKPAKNSASMVDTSLSWWVGDRKGFTFSTKLKKDF